MTIALLLALVALLPLAGALLTMVTRTARAAWRIAIGCSLVVLPLAFALFAITTRASAAAGYGFALDGLGAVLLPLVAVLSTAVLVASPRADLDRRTIVGLLAVESGTLGTLVSSHVAFLGAFFALSIVPLWVESRRRRDRPLERAFRFLVATAVVPLLCALGGAAYLGLRAGVEHPFDVVALERSLVFAEHHPWVGGLVLLAGAARMGVFPLHLWVPVVFERGRAPWAIPMVISPLGSFAIVRLGLSLSPPVFARALPAIVALGALSAAYGALLALGQNDAKRMLGYVWVSLVGFVLVGFASLDVRGMSGALFHAFATAIAVTGLALVIRSVEARTGTADMRRLGSLSRRAPRAAAGFFLLALATVGFPGGATFVSEDLVIHGLVRGHVLVAITLLIATALNGVTLIRAYKRIFLGPTSIHAPSDFTRIDDLLPRERWVVLGIVVAMLVGGLLPTPLLAVREVVVSSIRRGEP